jgi:glycosyltransferase involved in cell wall biosynthesis
MAEVSVVMAAHNAGRTIEGALESIRAQTVRDVEIIVIDDGSTDDTPSRLSKWAGRARWISQDHRGEGHALNRGLELASADLIAFLDPADLWLPRKLEIQVAQMRALEPAALSYTRSILSRTPGRLLSEARDILPLDLHRCDAARQFGAVYHDNALRTSTVLIRRRVLDELGGFDERTDIRPFETWDLWLRVAAQFPIAYLPFELSVQRQTVKSAGEADEDFLALERVVHRIASLYSGACERHPSNPQACTAERLYRLQSDLARARFWRGDAQGAREALEHAAAIQRLDVHDRAFMAAARGGRLLVGAAGRARERWRASKQDGAVSDRTSAFVQDTVYRRFRGTLAGAAHAVDDSLTRLTRRRLRVLFEAASPMSLAVFQPVFDRLVRDPRLEFWFTTCDHRWTADAIFHRVREHGRVASPAEVRWTKFDAYINADFWNTTWPARRSRRIHLFHGVAGKYGLDAPTGIAPVVSTFDRLMFPNRDRLRRYAEAGLVDPDSPRAALIGYPKVDCLVDGSLDRAAIQRELGVDPSRPTVLYAPTWSPYSSIASMGDRVVKALSALGVNVIVKLHDRSVEPNRGGSSIDWRARLTATVGGHVHVADGPNASPYMLAADLLVTDHSSVGFEFMLLDRPILVLECPELIERARINREKVDLLRSAADVVSSPDAIAPALERALLSPAAHSSCRRAIAEELFYCPGGASQRAAACIYQLLSLPVLEEQPASTPVNGVEGMEVRSPLPHPVRTS